MRFVVDAQLPPALAKLLCDLGYEAEHVRDCLTAGASDDDIWTFAIDFDAVIITKDEDFAHRKALRGAGPSVVWVRIPNTRRTELVAWFGRVLPNVIETLQKGETLVEIA